MIIIWGTRMYGKVDEVPGLCHVATQFFHLWYLPLVPLGSYAVIGEDDDGFQGKNIGLSFKSVLIAWLRTAMAVGAMFGLFLAIISNHDAANRMTGIALVVTCIVGMVASYRLGSIARASYSRALVLGNELGMSAEGKALIDLEYGRIDEAELKQVVEKAGAAKKAEEARRAEKIAAREAEQEARRAEKKAAREAERAAKKPHPTG